MARHRGKWAARLGWRGAGRGKGVGGRREQRDSATDQVGGVSHLQGQGAGGAGAGPPGWEWATRRGSPGGGAGGAVRGGSWELPTGGQQCSSCWLLDRAGCYFRTKFWMWMA